MTCGSMLEVVVEQVDVDAVGVCGDVEYLVVQVDGTGVLPERAAQGPVESLTCNKGLVFCGLYGFEGKEHRARVVVVGPLPQLPSCVGFERAEHRDLGVGTEPGTGSAIEQFDREDTVVEAQVVFKVETFSGDMEPVDQNMGEWADEVAEHHQGARFDSHVVKREVHAD